jgi:dipeptidyl aminopeptidase/acylaminoacyl peptidase
MIRFSTFFLVLTLFVSIGARAQSDDLDAYLAAPFRSSLTASADGSQLAWVEQIHGQRAILIARAPKFEPRRLRHFAEDDGLTISGLTFTPDGSTLLFTHGSGRNRAGDFPNPSGFTESPSQSVIGVDVASGRVWTVAEAGGVALSPDGREAIFARSGSVHIVPTTGGNAEAVFYVRQGAGQLTWSPDGRSIAFVSSRGDQAYVGIYDRGSDRVRWIAPSVDRDRAPTWSPDGKRIAFYRMEGSAPDAADTIFGPMSEPYSVWVASADGSDAREVWRSRRDGRDGYPAISGTRPLRWADDETLVFPAETSGWTHIYTVTADGGNVRALTSGECLIEETDFDRASGWLYYNHNCGDLEGRTLSRVHVQTGATETLTEGTHVVDWNPVVAGDALAFIRSTWQRPGTVHVMPVDGGVPGAIRDVATPDVPEGRMVRPENVRRRLIRRTDDLCTAVSPGG